LVTWQSSDQKFTQYFDQKIWK